MDILKLCEKVMTYDDIKGIPDIVVFTVIFCVIDAIGSGECFYKDFD